MDTNLEKFIDFVKWHFIILLQNMEKFKHLIRAFWVSLSFIAFTKVTDN